jgi:hemolysin activation/secretion protein
LIQGQAGRVRIGVCGQDRRLSPASRDFCCLRTVTPLLVGGLLGGMLGGMTMMKPTLAAAQAAPADAAASGKTGNDKSQNATGQNRKTQNSKAQNSKAQNSQTQNGQTQPAPATQGGGATPAQQSADAAKPTGPVAHFDIDDFAVQGATQLSQIELETAVYPFLGPDKTEDDVEKARAALEKAYHDKGFQTVSVAVPAQNVKNKVVTLKVTELKVGRLAVKNSHYFDVNKIKQDAPALEEGTVPNFNDVTKNIVSLNQWPDRKITPTLRAGVAPGTVDVDLNVDDTLPFHGSAEINDRKSPNTTPYRFTATGHYDDLWQLGHSVTFSYQVAPERPADAIVYSASYLARVPNVDWLSFLLYGVKSQSDVAAVGGLDVIGPGQIIGGRGVFTLPGSESFFHNLSLGIDYKSFGELVSLTGNGAGSDTPGSSNSSFSSPVTYYPIVASYTAQYHTDKLNAQMTASITNNLRPMSSNFVDFDNRRFNASGNFTHGNIDLSATQDLESGFQLYGRFQGQKADGPLVSSEQISIGGFDTVRGYLESETLGDDGAAGTFEIRTPNLGDWLAKLNATTPAAADVTASSTPSAAAQGAAPNTPGTPGSAGQLFNDLRLFGFVDAGVAVVQQPLPQQQSQFELWSYGVGTTFKMANHLNGMVALAVPMVTQTYTQARSTRVDFRIWGEF